MISKIKGVLKELKNNNATARSGVINMLVKPISMILSLIYTPLLVSYLGDEKYGLWATLLSIISWVNYFDVGIGNGLRNLLSKEISQRKFDDAKKSVSTAYVILTGIASVLYIILLISVFAFNWEAIFSTEIDMRATLLISFTFICVNFVLALSRTLLYALQKSEEVAIRNCVVQLINLVALLFIRRVSSGSLVAMAIVFGASSTIVHIGTTYNILRRESYLRINFRFFTRDKIGEIGKVGVKFFIIQIMALMVFTVDNLLITHFFGATEVTPFSIANRVFNTAYSMLAAFLVPYWSRSTVAFSNKDIKWLKTSLSQVAKITALFICGYLLLLAVFKPVVNIWMGRELPFGPGIPEIMCAFYVFYSILGVECQFINGSGQIGVQLITYIIAGIANIPLSIFFGVNLNMGSFGVRLASTMLVFMQIIVLGFNLKSILKRISEQTE